MGKQVCCVIRIFRNLSGMQPPRKSNSPGCNPPASRTPRAVTPGKSNSSGCNPPASRTPRAVTPRQVEFPGLWPPASRSPRATNFWEVTSVLRVHTPTYENIVQYCMSTSLVCECVIAMISDIFFEIPTVLRKDLWGESWQKLLSKSRDSKMAILILVLAYKLNIYILFTGIYE